jgi:hypothetical protein
MSHTHVPPFLLTAINYRKPAVLLLRRPEDAIASFCVLTGAKVPYLVRQWVLYYSIMQHRLDGVYLLPFEELTGGFQNAVRGIEEKFGLGLKTDFDETSIRKEAMAGIEAAYQGDLNAARIVNVPDQRRSTWLNVLKRKVMAAPGFDEAAAIYEAIVVSRHPPRRSI